MRKSFAVLLLGSWIGFSAVELLEAGELNTQASLQLSWEGSHPHGDVANDVLKFPRLTASCQPVGYEPAALCSGIDCFAVVRKAGKIYKALHVFLI